MTQSAVINYYNWCSFCALSSVALLLSEIYIMCKYIMTHFNGTEYWKFFILLYITIQYVVCLQHNKARQSRLKGAHSQSSSSHATSLSSSSCHVCHISILGSDLWILCRKKQDKVITHVVTFTSTRPPFYLPLSVLSSFSILPSCCVGIWLYSAPVQITWSGLEMQMLHSCASSRLLLLATVLLIDMNPSVDVWSSWLGRHCCIVTIL